VGLTKFFKLEKLKIKAYAKKARVGVPEGTFEAMFNPESFQQKYAVVYGKKQGRNSSGKDVQYDRSLPSDLDLKLILDGTDASQSGVFAVAGYLRKSNMSVSQQVKKFLDLTFHMNGEIHQPNYLSVEWGDLIFACRLSSVDVNYTSFDRSGKPLRAELDISLVAAEEVIKRQAIENKSSPDLTHRRIVKSGDTLPLMTQEIYGSSIHYLRVAQVNRINDFRNLKPGLEIFFPPLET